MSTAAEQERQLDSHCAAAPLTLLVWSVLYIVGSISEVCDHGFSAASRRVADQSFNVFSPGLGQSTSIHGEVGGGISEDS